MSPRHTHPTRMRPSRHRPAEKPTRHRRGISPRDLGQYARSLVTRGLCSPMILESRYTAPTRRDAA